MTSPHKQPEHEINHPLFDDILVVALTPDKWHSPWMARHHVMSRLGKYFRVLWVDPPRHVQDLYREKRSPQYNHCTTACRNGFTTLELKTPSVYGPKCLAELLLKLQCHEIDSAVKKYKPSKVVMYLWRHTFKKMLDKLQCDHVCYHIDDEYSFSNDDRPTCSLEKLTIRKADRVFVHSPQLYQKKGKLNIHAHLLPMGADYKHFATPTSEPDDLKDIPKPRIGYIGYIKGQLNLEMLADLADMNKEYSFVFVGPENRNISKFKTPMEELKSLSNVYFLGSRDIEMLPAYTQHMDVLLLPYRVDGYTKFISPMKLNEYLSTGRPVVASEISYLKQFANILYFAETPEQWSAMIKKALESSQNNFHMIRRRQIVAAQSDWEKITHRIAAIIAGDLGRCLPMLMNIREQKFSEVKKICEVIK